MKTSRRIAVLLALLPGLSAQSDPQADSSVQAPASSTLQLAGGRITTSYYPVELGNRSLESTQERGTVWSMSEREAALLDTTVALVAGKTLIPPGRYRMSSWYRRRGVWRLLIFANGKNYQSGTPYFDVALNIDALDQPVSTMQLQLQARGARLQLELRGGRSRLRASFQPLAVTRYATSIVGKPATFEFYAWPATPDIQARIRAFEPIQFGRLRHDMPFGVVYDLSCRSDGKGVFIDAKTSTLADNRRLLRLASTARPVRIAALRQAIAMQKGLQTNVLLAANTITERPRMGFLQAQPQLVGDTSKRLPAGTTFLISYGLRRVEFSIPDARFKRLVWK